MDLDSAYDLGLIEIVAKPDGTYDVLDRSDSYKADSFVDIEGAHASQRMTGIDGVYLMNVPNSWLEKLNSPFNLIVFRSKGGTFKFGFIGTDRDHLLEVTRESPLRGARVDYLYGVMERHLKGGELTAEKQLEIFSDPAFLGGFRYSNDNWATLYPAQMSALPQVSDEDAKWSGAWEAPLTSAGFMVDPQMLAFPEGIEGNFTVDGERVQIMRDPDDGSYHAVTYGSYESNAVRFKLLALPQDNSFLAVQSQYIKECDDDTQPVAQCPLVERFRFDVVNLREDGSVTTRDVNLAANSHSRVLNEFITQLRDEAVSRHGLTMIENDLQGPLDTKTLLALFTDPQFQATLVPSRSVRLLRRVKTE